MSAFAYLDWLRATKGEYLSHVDLKAFEFEGNRVPLLGQRGIRVVRGLASALSITTVYRRRDEDRPYQDEIGPDMYVRYQWQGTDESDHDNRALHHALTAGDPLIYFYGVEQGTYHSEYPVWVVGWEIDQHRAVVALTEDLRAQWGNQYMLSHPADLALRRRYAERMVRQRLHQPRFSRAVLRAYEHQCAACRLRRTELLDAAHIREDADGGEPVVPNGVALCAIHHRAFDAQVLGIRPDYVLEIRQDVLDEQDGPTLKHSLQGIHHRQLLVPRRATARPDPELLEERYARFQATG
jgi:putative restriction endonuclease